MKMTLAGVAHAQAARAQARPGKERRREVRAERAATAAAGARWFSEALAQNRATRARVVRR